MAMPGELTIHVGDADFIIIVPRYDAGIPMVGEARELLRQTDDVPLHRSISPNTMSSEPRIAVASASMWPLLMKSMA